MDLDAVKKEVVETCGLDEFGLEDARLDESGTLYHRFYAEKVFGARTYYVYGAWTRAAMGSILPDLIRRLKTEFDEAEKQVTHDVQ